MNPTHAASRQRFGMLGEHAPPHATGAAPPGTAPPTGRRDGSDDHEPLLPD